VTPRSQRPRLSARQRKLWWSALSITVGTLVLGALVWWIERARDTDRADARADVTSTFKQEAIAHETPVRFADVTAAAGLELNTANYQRHRALPEDNGSGLAWGDYDDDGFMDLYVIRHPGIVSAPGKGPPPGNRLFHNNGDGTFTDVTERAGVADRDGFGMGATWVDFDDDGLLDLYVTNRGPNRLFKNRGNGTFVDVAVHAGVADPLWGTGTAWGDFDRDGHIDFYLCNYVNYDSVGHEPPVSASQANSAGDYEAPYTLNPNSYDPQPNRLFRNRGDGAFEDVTAPGGVADPDGRSLAATFVDLDGDGWLDLYVNNDVSPDRLYRNSGADFGPDSPITFFDLSAVAGTADSRGSMGLSIGEIGDLDGAADGLPDVFITHWVAQENAFYQSLVTPSGKLEYRDKARPFRLGEISIDRVGWGCAMVDLDLDGRVDIAVANGSTLEKNDNPALLKPEPMFLFMNDGTGFRDVAPLAGAATTRLYNARGLAVADYNNDGYPDIAISTNEGEVRLLRNDTHNGNRSLTVMLKGHAAYCFGAKVEVWTGGHCQYRWWGADVSYLSQHASQLIFGLGRMPMVEKMIVHWTDGRTSTLTNVPAGVVRIDHASATNTPSIPAS
jgi:hypothetical protein